MIFVNDEYMYKAFPLFEKGNRISAERTMIGSKVPRRYLRHPHYLVIQNGAPSGIDKDTLGLIPYVYVSKEIFDFRFERTEGEPDYVYRLKRLDLE